MGLYGPVWACMALYGPYGTVWACMGLYGPVWACMAHCMGLYGLDLACMTKTQIRNIYYYIDYNNLY